MDRDAGGYIVTGCSHHSILTLITLFPQKNVTEVYKNPTGVTGKLQREEMEKF